MTEGDNTQHSSEEQHAIEALVVQAKAGNRSAMGRLLVNLIDPLTRYVAARMPATLQGVIEPSDVVQESLRIAWRDVHQFEYRGEHSFFAWLCTIAQHQIADAGKMLHRKKRGGDFRQVQLPKSHSDSMLQVFDLVTSDDATPLRKVSRAEALNLMAVALAELPENHQQVIRMRYLDDLSYEQIAEQLGKTTQAVHGLLKRAKESLKEGLGRASKYLSS